MRILVLWALLLGSIIVVRAEAMENADLILVNGRIVTVDDQFSIAQAIAVKDRRIAAVGTNEQIRSLAGAGTEEVDLSGHTVIPGLIDTHSHIVRASQLWKYEVRFDGITHRAEALAILQAAAEDLEPGRWIVNLGGWVEDQFIDAPGAFTLQELDSAAPHNPVYLDVNYSHGYANSKLLELAEIPVRSRGAQQAKGLGEGSTANPHGFRESMIERDGQGRATGKIGPFAYSQVAALLPVVSDDDGLEGLKQIMRDANAAGLTAIYDGGGFGILEDAYERVGKLASTGQSTLRVFRTRYLTASTPTEAIEQMQALAGLRPFSGTDYYQVLGVGEGTYLPVHDGFDEAIEMSADNRRAVTTIFSEAARMGWQIHQHAVRDDTMSFMLDVVDDVAGEHTVKPLRWLFIHADLITRPTIDRMRTHGMSPSIRSHSVIGGPLRAANARQYGERIYSIPDLRQIQASGIRWSFGSEAPRINVLNPLASLAWAVTGKRFYDLEPVITTTVTREEALIAHTRSAAYQIFQENNLGQIRPGFLADLVVLDKDYLEVPPDHLFNIKVKMTFVGGRKVFDALD